MKSLPKNISAHPDGLLIRVQRGEVLFQAFVPASAPAALEDALRLRDKFLKLAGPKARRRLKAKSNTGILGISESTMWRHSRPYDCFCVSLDKDSQHRSRRLIYGNGRSRESALRQAIALRARLLGVSTDEITKGAVQHA